VTSKFHILLPSALVFLWRTAAGTPGQFAAIIKRDIEVWRGVVKRAGVKAE
jgi:hypothetical protein